MFIQPYFNHNSETHELDFNQKQNFLSIIHKTLFLRTHTAHTHMYNPPAAASNIFMIFLLQHEWAWKGIYNYMYLKNKA
jgi:hypothetical protein